jgi:hypothetical protein
VAPAETAEQASAIVVKLIADQAAAASHPGADGDPMRAAVYASHGLTAAQAQAKLNGTLTNDQKADLALSPDGAVVLGVSRGADYPRVVVFSAKLAKSGSLALVLATAADAATGYRIIAVSTMLPSASVGGFDPQAGSPVVADGAGLAVANEALLNGYAASLAYPAPAAADQPFTDDAFASGVKAGAKAQAKALTAAGTFRQTHDPIGVDGGLRAADGGALVFLVMQRNDKLTEGTANALTPTAAFTALTGKTVIDKSATLRSLEFVVFHVPVSGKATAVAAAEQLYAASGS